ncbi:DoxX family protein [Fibrisoma montanum]|uniref:DoxX family protein n=1 Tax=Fibrisoma montanum TaxID=2305895 RepID=A0A418MFJ9_9BACT|nr:DoxX family protein [Fibrisoma montanum]RIV25556.1 DoxX family protein [Fibrisoma montanum]
MTTPNQPANPVSKSAKTTAIAYWIFTGLFSFIMLGSAIPDILVSPEAVQGFKDMGYPAYLIPFLGWAKLFGVLAILVPGFPRLKEWAYAGLFIDLVGATYSIYKSGIPFAMWAPMLIFILLGVGSYVFYHKRLKAAAAASQPTPPPVGAYPSVQTA